MRMVFQSGDEFRIMKVGKEGCQIFPDCCPNSNISSRLWLFGKRDFFAERDILQHACWWHLAAVVLLRHTAVTLSNNLDRCQRIREIGGVFGADSKLDRRLLIISSEKMLPLSAKKEKGDLSSWQLHVFERSEKWFCQKICSFMGDPYSWPLKIFSPPRMSKKPVFGC